MGSSSLTSNQERLMGSDLSKNTLTFKYYLTFKTLKDNRTKAGINVTEGGGWTGPLACLSLFSISSVDDEKKLKKISVALFTENYPSSCLSNSEHWSHLD